MHNEKMWIIMAILVCLISAQAAAEEQTVYISGEYEYVLLEDDTAEIVNYTGNAAELVVPAQLDGYTIIGIGEGAFFGCTSLTSIVLPEGLTNIGDAAFSECSNLTSIVLPESLTTLGASAFFLSASA